MIKSAMDGLGLHTICTRDTLSLASSWDDEYGIRPAVEEKGIVDSEVTHRPAGR